MKWFLRIGHGADSLMGTLTLLATLAGLVEIAILCFSACWP
jgi:hypothetical protein